MQPVKRLMAMAMVLAMLVTNLPLGVLAAETDSVQTLQASAEETAMFAAEEETAAEAEEETAAEAEEETAAEAEEETAAESEEEIAAESQEETAEEAEEETAAESQEETAAEASDEETAEQEAALTTAQNEPYLTWYWLNNDGSGWYENTDGYINTDMRIMAYGNWWCIFYLNLWNETDQDFDAYPVNLSTDSPYLDICHVTEVNDYETVRDGEVNGDYFTHIMGVNTIEGADAQVSCSYGGETYTFDFTVTPREMGFYSAPEAKLEYVLGQAYLDPDSDEYSVYFIQLDPENCVYDSFEWEVHTDGRDFNSLCCDGEEFITKIDHENGVIEFKLNPKYVQYVKSRKTYEWIGFNLYVYGGYHMADNSGNGWFDQSVWIAPDRYDDYYLSVGWLNNMGEGWYLNEESVMGGFDMNFGIQCVSDQYVMFFLNSLDESTGTWTRTPVIPTEDSPYVTIEKITDLENDMQPKEGEQYGDYFLRVSSHDTLEMTQFDLNVSAGSRTLRFASIMFEQDIAFYSENRIALDTIYSNGVHMSMDASPMSFYLLKKNDINLENVKITYDDFGGDYQQYTDGEDLITVTEIEDGWKIDVNETFIETAVEYKNYRWLNFLIYMEADVVGPNGEDYGTYYTNLMVYPPMDQSSFIMAYCLEEYGEGWVNPQNAPEFDLGMGAASDRYLFFCLVPWDEESQTWLDEVPVVPVSHSPNLIIETINAEEIQEGQENSEYFCRLTATEMDYEAAQISVEYNGETVYAPFFIYERELAFYSENSVSKETIITNGMFTLDAEADENAVYLLMKDPGEYLLQNMQWQVETHGRDEEYAQYVTGDQLVTMTEISGGYKFVIDPGFVAAAYANTRYDWMNFNIQVTGDWCESDGTKLNDYWQDVWVNPPQAGNAPYINAAYLENDGEGWYLPEGRYPEINFGTRAMDCSWLIFYLNTWNEATGQWDVTPIIPYENSEDLTITKVTELPEEFGDSYVREDQTYGDYFVQVLAENSLDASTETVCYEYNGTTVSAPFRVHARELSFYDDDTISVETCMPMRMFYIDKAEDAENAIYFRTYDTGDWTIGDVEFEVFSHGYDYLELTYGEDAVTMEKLSDGTGYKFVLSQNYVDWVCKHYKYDWRNLQLCVTGYWYDEYGVQQHEFRDECWINPPEDTDPFIMAWRLQNDGEGWYVLEDEPTVDYGTRGLDWSWYVFFLFTWDETQGKYVPQPIIPDENSENLSITRILDLPENDPQDQVIREDQIRGEYMVQVRSYNHIDGEHVEKMYYTDDAGNTYEMDFTIYHRETGFYSESTRSVDTAIVWSQIQLDSKAEENAVYYLIDTPYDHTYENVSFTLNTWGQDYSTMYCDGEDLVTMEALADGTGYKLTVNPKYVQAMSTGTDWKNFSINMEYDRVSSDGNSQHENWEQIWINPPERFDPYLSWGYLNDEGEGWFFDSERMGGTDHYWIFEMTGMNDRWVVFFLNTYNEATGQWTQTPFVPTLEGENIYMYTMEEAGDTVAEDAQYAEYYRHIKSRGSLNYSEFTFGCENVTGYEDLTFTGRVIDRELGFYTTEEPSVDTILHRGETALDPNGENVFYLSKLFEDAELRDFTWGINSWGENYSRYCDGEPVVTMEETARGYKFTVNPKYVQYVTEHVYDDWKNFCLHISAHVYGQEGMIDIIWEDALWINPPDAAVNLDEIVNSEMTSEEKKEAVQEMDTDALKNAMENNETVVEQIQQLEKDFGTKVAIDTTEDSPVTAEGIVGAGLNDTVNETEDITLVVDAPAEEKSDEEIDENYDSSVNIQFSMTLDNVANTENLDVPVLVTLEVPEGVDVDLMVLLHYHGTEVDQVDFKVSVRDGKTYITFALAGFSDFVITHQKIGDVNRDGTIDDADVIYVMWHTLFPEAYPLETVTVDLNKDEKVTAEDALEMLWKALF